jgi:hypothetical protein
LRSAADATTVAITLPPVSGWRNQILIENSRPINDSRVTLAKLVGDQ